MATTQTERNGWDGALARPSTDGSGWGPSPLTATNQWTLARPAATRPAAAPRPTRRDPSPWAAPVEVRTQAHAGWGPAQATSVSTTVPPAAIPELFAERSVPPAEPGVFTCLVAKSPAPVVEEPPRVLRLPQAGVLLVWASLLLAVIGLFGPWFQQSADARVGRATYDPDGTVNGLQAVQRELAFGLRDWTLLIDGALVAGFLALLAAGGCAAVAELRPKLATFRVLTLVSAGLGLVATGGVAFACGLSAHALPAVGWGWWLFAGCCVPAVAGAVGLLTRKL